LTEAEEEPEPKLEPFKTGPFFGHGQYSVPHSPYPGKLSEPKSQPPKPQFNSGIADQWTFGKMAAKMIADATAAAESASGQGELPAAEIKPEIPPDPLAGLEPGGPGEGYPESVGLTAFTHPMQLSQKEKERLR
jgi:hypothetical protein